MKKVVPYLKNLRLREILTIFLAGVILCLNTACNSGNVQGARPDVPPVQMGGQNNPHKMGGDGYTNYKSPANRQLNNNAAVFNSDKLLAAKAVDENYPGLLYKEDTEADTNRLPVNKMQKADTKSESLREKGKTLSGKTLEEVKDTFKTGSEFIKGAGEQVSPRYEK